ncbi:leucine-rich repeat-containing protein 2 isoform X3 [Poeciliopsis prolifica]|uniref:leucine-rich repeat-containing protein 2 isoform X3 n=1 Tax=Poeciliopsis prolifica TaxID=188132 RepID=UPI0024138563|nr:leucine-rich repeat-containing protein 2 isoform X3 [Poeciliopsis prolifica]
MGPNRKFDVPVYDLSAVRGIWEVRVKKYRTRQKKEQERVENSALARIDQQWQYRIYCKSMKAKELQQLHHYLERSLLTEPHGAHLDRNPGSMGKNPNTDVQQQEDHPDAKDLIFQLEGDRWLVRLSRELQWTTYLQEWHVRRTRIRQLPDFLALFTQLTVLEIPRNLITDLPPQIGKLAALRRLNVSYNRLSRVPPELGDCEKLERLELAGNLSLSELPFELSSLKQLVHLDISENRFASIPVCALRMSRLQLLDLSNNQLSDLPQDMDRLQQLSTLFVHSNRLSYLPVCLTNISSLRMVVASGDALTCVPTSLCNDPTIKFIRLYDNPERKRREVKDGSEKEFMEAYIGTLKDRDSVPFSTTKVSISCLL